MCAAWSSSRRRALLRYRFLPCNLARAPASSREPGELMPATFKVIGTLALRSRKQLIVLGDLVNGEIHRGMEFTAPEGDRSRAGRVDSIEFVDFMSLRPDCPALVLH